MYGVYINGKLMEAFHKYKDAKRFSSNHASKEDHVRILEA
jgi:hypothetical protein